MMKAPEGGGATDLESYAKLSAEEKRGAMVRYKQKKLRREKMSSILDDADPDFDISELGASSTQQERDRACVMTLRGHTGTVWSIEANSNIIISGSSDQTIRLWRASDGKMLRRVRGHTGTVRCIGLGEQAFATGGADREVRIWTYEGPRRSPCQSFQQAAILDGHDCIVTAIAIAGFECVSGGADGRIIVWDVPEKRKARDFNVHKGTVTALQFDATKVVSAGNDLAIRVCDIISGAQLQVITEAHSMPILDLMYDTQQLVTVAGDHTLRIWSWGDSQAETSARMHIVAAGQTPQDIAKMYGVTVKELMKWNKLATANEMYMGRRLMVAPTLQRDEGNTEAVDDDKKKVASGAGGRASPLQASPRPASRDRPSTGGTIDFSRGQKLFKKVEFKGRIKDVLDQRQTLRQLRKDLQNKKWGDKSKPLTSVPGYVSVHMLEELVELEDAKHTMDERALAERSNRLLMTQARRMQAIAQESRDRMEEEASEFGDMGGFGYDISGGGGGYGGDGLDPEMGGDGDYAAAVRREQ